MKPTNNMEYYNFMNLQQYLDQCKVKGIVRNFRYLKDYVNTKISMFKYKNLPEGITSRIIETALCFNNFLCFYKNTLFPNGVVARYLPSGDLDEYWRPKKVDIITLTGVPVAYGVPFSDIVPMIDNSMNIIPFVTITEYIEKIAYTETTLMKNVRQARIPAFFSGTKEQVASFNKIIQKTDDEDAFAIADPKATEAMSQYDIKFSIQPKDMIEIMKNYQNWCIQSFGMYAGSSQKAERMLVSEVQSQTDYSDTIYQDEKDCRTEFIEAINKKFGLKIELVESYREYMEDHIKLSQGYAIAQVQNAANLKPQEKGDNNE